MRLPLPWEIKADRSAWTSPMKLPPGGTRHDQTSVAQTLNQVLGTYAGQKYVGLPWKAPAFRNYLAQDRCNFFVRQFLLGRLKEHQRSLADENKTRTSLAHENV